MDARIYEAMAAAEDKHWWFRGRRRILDAQIERLALPPNARILEAGCGSGGNLKMLARHGEVSAFEYDAKALAFAQQRGIGRVVGGRLPDGVPFEGEQFDLIVLFDVMEHLDDDRAALRALLPRLRPGGALLVTVPALGWLWGPHDKAHHHRRRYTRPMLLNVLTGTGLRPELCSYCNTLLFPLAAARRLWQRASSSSAAPDLTLPPAPLNRTLEEIFASERHLLPHASLPVGVSLLAVARAP